MSDILHYQSFTATFTLFGSAEYETTGKASVSVTLLALDPPLEQDVTVTLKTIALGNAIGKQKNPWMYLCLKLTLRLKGAYLAKPQ